MIDDKSQAAALSTEPPAEHPVFLIGGTCEGQAYLMRDRPRYVQAAKPMRYEPLRADADFTYDPIKIETYVLREARVGRWETPWLYYAHESLDEEHAMLALWSFLWDVGSRFARAGGFEAEKRCEWCHGTGVAR